MDYKAGDNVGKYKLKEQLGQGSSGYVWLAEDQANSQQFVMKLIPLAGWRKLEFEREIETLENINHVNIIKLHDWNNINKTGIIVLEKLDCDLLEFLDDYSINEMEARMMFRQILAGIGYMHKNCIAHMDIKPENILIRGTNVLKIADLGSTYRWTDLESAVKSGKAGTSFYCAPEVKSSKPYNAEKADIWSLGITLHVMMTGFWPYLGQTEKEVLSNAKKGKVNIADDQLSQTLVDFLNTMLVINPLDRPDVPTLLKHKWFSQETESDLVFTPRDNSSESVSRVTSAEKNVCGEKNGIVLPELSLEGLKSPRQCQMMLSPRLNEGIVQYDDGLIRPSPRGEPMGGKATKLEKFLNNFRRFGKKI